MNATLIFFLSMVPLSLIVLACYYLFFVRKNKPTPDVEKKLSEVLCNGPN